MIRVLAHIFLLQTGHLTLILVPTCIGGPQFTSSSEKLLIYLATPLVRWLSVRHPTSPLYEHASLAFILSSQSAGQESNLRCLPEGSSFTDCRCTTDSTPPADIVTPRALPNFALRPGVWKPHGSSCHPTHLVTLPALRGAALKQAPGRPPGSRTLPNGFGDQHAAINTCGLRVGKEGLEPP
jgi:hypothetical protein